jgi:serine/threonine protein kinase
MFKDEITEICTQYIERVKTIDDRYKLFYKLGEGRYGKVFLTLDIKTGNLIALKLLKKNSSSSKLNSFLTEIENLVYISRIKEDKIKTPRILDFNLNGKYQNSSPVAYYTMLLVEMGELYSIIELEDKISETLACFFVKEIINSLKKLHSYEIYHFDLKPENILLNLKGHVFLCDFGHCLCLEKNSNQSIKNQSFLGSFEYSAPEVYEIELLQKNSPNTKNIKNKILEYDLQKLDTFSLGVILFVLIMKSFPFSKACMSDDYFKTFIESKETFWKIFSDLRDPSKDFKDIIHKMLDPVNKTRFTISDILNHSWILKNQRNQKMKEELDNLISQKKMSFKKKIIDELQNNFQKNKFKNSHKKPNLGILDLFENFNKQYSDKIDNLKSDLKSILLVDGINNDNIESVRKFSL